MFEKACICAIIVFTLCYASLPGIDLVVSSKPSRPSVSPMHDFNDDDVSEKFESDFHMPESEFFAENVHLLNAVHAGKPSSTCPSSYHNSILSKQPVWF